MPNEHLLDIDHLISQLELDEKVGLLTGAGVCALNGNERLGIPVIHTSDGPHGLRGGNFFNPVPGCQLPCATAMGSTFDTDLLHRIGGLLGAEAMAKNKHVILAPTVCLQRSPLLGRGFEAFGEDPVLSGTLGGFYVKGIQEKKIASCIKHYAAHDQSDMSIEDNVQMTGRTLREMHLLPFQIALRIGDPWAVMTAYNKINGVHASEDPFLIEQVLRKEWGFDGLVMSDWWGTYSTSEAINAGLDLEMPGPTVWRGKALSWAVESRKVPRARVDEAVRNVLTLINKTVNSVRPLPRGDNNTAESRALARKVAADSIVLLKNDRNVLPLDAAAKKSYALIGDHFLIPATTGGGSSEATPYYISKPYDAIMERVGAENITYATGCYSHKFTPLITTELCQPGSDRPGLRVEMFEMNPDEHKHAECLWAAETQKSLLQFTDSLPGHLPKTHFMRVRSTFTAPATMRYRFGLSCLGKARMRIDGKEVIDLWTSQPPKTDITPVFSAFSMERFHDLHLIQGQRYEIEMLLWNVFDGFVVGIQPAGGVRLGGYRLQTEDSLINEAVSLAEKVDYPIILTGLSSDYETESAERKTLALPGRIDELVQRVAAVNPNTIVVTQSGLPVSMPWVQQVHTLAHAWYGGQETGNGLADILFGTVNPSGRLSVTFPKRIQDTPAFLNYGKSDRTILYGEGVFLGYRYYEKLENPPMFFFGYGLSYTRFEYSNLIVPDTFPAAERHIMKISLDVTNVGDWDGAEVVQLYISDLAASVQRPRKELKAFQKVHVPKGETRTCHVELDKYALSFWSEEHSKWRAEGGRFKVILARSADPADEIVEKEFELLGTFMWSGL